MERFLYVIKNIKSIGFILGILLSSVIYLYNLSQAPIELNKRVTACEERSAILEKRDAEIETRVAYNENRISLIEVKLDTLISQGSETHKDVKDIYHLILDKHK